MHRRAAKWLILQNAGMFITEINRINKETNKQKATMEPYCLHPSAKT